MSKANPSLQVIVLAAGKGSRMRSAVPKVLHRVAGVSLLEHVLNAAFALSPTKVHIVVGHKKDDIIQAFSHHPNYQDICWVDQTEQLGTGHAVAQALPNIPSEATVLILTADVPLIQSHTLALLTELMSSHSLAVLTAKVTDPTGFGRIVRDSSDNIQGIVEHKDATEAQRKISEINSGIMVASAHRLRDWLSNLDQNNQQSEFYLTDIIALAVKDGDSVGTLISPHADEVNGINDRAQLAAAERIAQQQQIAQYMLDGVTCYDPTRVDIRGDVTIGADTSIDINVIVEGITTIGSNVTIGPNCLISNSHIADNVTIHANSVIDQANIAAHCNIGPFARLRPGTELSKGVRVGNFVETKNAQFGSDSKVNHLSYVGDATVGEYTNIGAGVITCNYDGANKHQTIIGNNVFVGSDSQLVAPVTISDGATIGAGSTITSDVKQDQLALTRSKQRHIDTWKRPVKRNPRE